MTTNPLVATAVEAPKDAWAGVWIAEDIQLIQHGVQQGSWIDATLGTTGASLAALSLVVDPAGTLVQYGIAWLIEHVKPLSDALDWLAGDPAQITAHAHTWRNIAQSLQASSDNLRQDNVDWHGAAAQAYRTWATDQREAIAGIATAADTMATITEAAASLIAAVRIMVRDAIATVVSRIAVYAVELIASMGAATPWVVEQVTALVAAWAARIARWLKALLASIRQLMPVLRRLGQLIEELKKILGRLVNKNPHGQHEPSEPPRVLNDPAHPDFSNPDIDSRKIAGYAMNPDHPVGGNKYRVINSKTGLGPDDAALIEQQIRDGVRNGTPILGKLDQYGQRYNVDLPLTGPDGTIIVRTAWIIDSGSANPRMVTISFP